MEITLCTTTTDFSSCYIVQVCRKWQMTKNLDPKHTGNTPAVPRWAVKIKQDVQRHHFREKRSFVPVIIYYVHCVFTSSAGWSWGVLSSACPSSAFDSRSAGDRDRATEAIPKKECKRWVTVRNAWADTIKEGGYLFKVKMHVYDMCHCVILCHTGPHVFHNVWYCVLNGLVTGHITWRWVMSVIPV